MRKVIVIFVLIAASLTSCNRGVKILTNTPVAEYINTIGIKIDSVDISLYHHNIFHDRIRIKQYIIENDYFYVDDILKEMHNDGYIPASLNQVLAYISKLTDKEDDELLHGKYGILVLGSKYKDKNGYTHLPFIQYSFRDMAMGYTISEMVVNGDNSQLTLARRNLVILASKKY